MPVDQAYDIALRPVAVPGDALVSAIQGGVTGTLVTAGAGRDVPDVVEDVFGMPSRMAVAAPFDMQEVLDFLQMKGVIELKEMEGE